MKLHTFVFTLEKDSSCEHLTYYIALYDLLVSIAYTIYLGNYTLKDARIWYF